MTSMTGPSPSQTLLIEEMRLSRRISSATRGISQRWVREDAEFFLRIMWKREARGLCSPARYVLGYKQGERFKGYGFLRLVASAEDSTHDTRPPSEQAKALAALGATVVFDFHPFLALASDQDWVLAKLLHTDRMIVALDLASPESPDGSPKVIFEGW